MFDLSGMNRPVCCFDEVRGKRIACVSVRPEVEKKREKEERYYERAKPRRENKKNERTIKSNGISDALFIYLALKLFSSARLYEWVFVVQKGLEILFRRNCKKSVFDRFFPRCLERIRSGQTLLKEKKAPRKNIEN